MYGCRRASVGAALGLACLTHLVRSLFLTGWAYAHGPEAISGFIHDAAGYAVLGLTAIGLLLLVPVLNLEWDRGAAGAESETTGAMLPGVMEVPTVVKTCPVVPGKNSGVSPSANVPLTKRAAKPRWTRAT